MRQDLDPESLDAGLLAALDDHAIVSVADVDGRIQYVNQKFCDISGYTPEELVGSSHRLLKSGMHDASYYGEMWQHICSGRSWRGEICNRRKSGELYWVDATITPQLDSAGLPCRYVSIRTDITATKRAQHRAETAEERYRRSQIFGNIGTWDLDLRSGELFWSERVAPLFGGEVGELWTSYDRFVDAVHPQDRDAVTMAIRHSIDGDTAYEIEHRCIWPDGSVHWLAQRGNVMRGARGDALRMLGVVQDITARKQAQAQMTLFRQAVECTGEGVVLYDAQGNRLSFVNTAACTIVGWSAPAALNSDPLEFVPVSARPQWARAIERARRGRSARIEFVFTRPDGREVPLRNTLTAVTDDTGGVTHFVNVFGDRSEEIERQNELQSALDAARRANRAKAEFMSHMSHELRTPLNAILGFSQVLLLRQDLSVAQNDSVHEVLRAGKHLLALVDEVLDISRIDLGTLRVSLEPVLLNDVTTQALALVASAAREREVSIAQGIDAALVVRADHLRLKQCLINLMSDAVGRSPRGGPINVRASEPSGGRVRIEIADRGAHVAADELARLPHHVSAPDQAPESGEGISVGLSITRRLVKLMNGRFGLHGLPGVGNVAWIELERAELHAGHRCEASAYGGLDLLRPLDANARKRVLYVEDNPANLKLVRSMLRLLPGVAVLTATSAAEGMSMALDERPHMILLDIGLPDTSGFELLAWLQGDPELSATPVVAISANALPDDVERGLMAGFDDYLTKPIDVHKLLDLVQATLALQGRAR